MSERPAADNVPPPAFFSSDAERQRAVEQQVRELQAGSGTEAIRVQLHWLQQDMTKLKAEVAKLIAERDAALAADDLPQPLPATRPTYRIGIDPDYP